MFYKKLYHIYLVGRKKGNEWWGGGWNIIFGGRRMEYNIWWKEDGNEWWGGGREYLVGRKKGMNGGEEEGNEWWEEDGNEWWGGEG